MRTAFRKSFARDLKKIKTQDVLDRIRRAIEEVEAANDLRESAKRAKMRESHLIRCRMCGKFADDGTMSSCPYCGVFCPRPYTNADILGSVFVYSAFFLFLSIIFSPILFPPFQPYGGVRTLLLVVFPIFGLYLVLRHPRWNTKKDYWGVVWLGSLLLGILVRLIV